MLVLFTVREQSTSSKVTHTIIYHTPSKMSLMQTRERLQLPPMNTENSRKSLFKKLWTFNIGAFFLMLTGNTKLVCFDCRQTWPNVATKYNFTQCFFFHILSTVFSCSLNHAILFTKAIHFPMTNLWDQVYYNYLSWLCNDTKLIMITWQCIYHEAKTRWIINNWQYILS